MNGLKKCNRLKRVRDQLLYPLNILGVFLRFYRINVISLLIELDSVLCYFQYLRKSMFKA